MVVEMWCQPCDVSTVSKGPRTQSRGEMQQYNVGIQYKCMEQSNVFPEICCLGLPSKKKSSLDYVAEVDNQG